MTARERRERSRVTVAAVLGDKDFMRGVYDALDEEARGTPPTPAAKLKRKNAKR